MRRESLGLATRLAGRLGNVRNLTRSRYQVGTFLSHPTISGRCLHCSPPIAASKKAADDGDTKLYSHTLQLPRTAFEIRANAAKRDKLFYDRTCSELYRWQKERTDSTGSFVFHDGPPYANGNLHCGHALNKILKDISNRYQVLRGKQVHYMPGWDCHGLPIEAKALAKLQTVQRDELAATEIRERASSEAKAAIEIQKQEFAQLGIMADWSDNQTYRTLDPRYEARQLRVFGEMVRKRLIYRQYRPVYWSPSNKTALAESELEYRDDHLSKAVYVSFDLIPGPHLQDKLTELDCSSEAGVKAIIWTTTPWSLPSNAALNVNPEMQYSLVRRDEQGSTLYLIASERTDIMSGMESHLEKLKESEQSRPTVGPFSEVGRIVGTDLCDTTYRSPLSGRNAPARPILMADYVTNLSGTGIVHSAPAHGAEDYQIWKQQGFLSERGIYSPVDELGRYSEEISQLDADRLHNKDEAETLSSRLLGKDVLTDGAREVIAILRERGALVSIHTLRHKYPYDWRSKQPVIVRATAQWFANLDRIKEDAIAALQNVTFVPQNSRARLESFISGRSEWCISRQRVWGVPIPVLYDQATDEPLMTVENIEHIASILEEKGTDYWWQAEAQEFVLPQYHQQGRAWRKGEDTIDVWFDSGTSWATLRDSLPTAMRQARQDQALADVYLEGSDQHRGWFQSSLITAVAATPDGKKPVAPYKTVITHGYVLDNESQKMSKSLGNVMSPLSIINGGPGRDQIAYGIDVLRLWAAKSDYTDDPPIGSLIISKTAETLRKLRNTARFMLANLPLPSEVADLDASKMTLLDRFVMHELYQLEIRCAEAYESFDFAQVVRRITEFTNSTLSNLYLDIAKDCLYVDSVESIRRKSMVAVIDQVLRTYTSILAPIVPILAEEIHHFRQGAKDDPADETIKLPSVFSLGWQKVDEVWSDADVAREAGLLLDLRNRSMVLIEQARKASLIKTSFEVEVDLRTEEANSTITSILHRHEAELTQIFNVARVTVSDSGSDTSAEAKADWKYSDQHANVVVMVRRSRRDKCPRCRTFRREPGQHQLCKRCQNVLDNLPR